MAVRVVRLGSRRAPGEGVGLGTVRRPLRGVRKDAYAARDYYDAWLPELAPSAPLLSWAPALPCTPRRSAAFARRYQREMKQPPARHLLALLAALSARTDISVGCYCEDETRRHRSLLRELLIEQGADVPDARRKRRSARTRACT